MGPINHERTILWSLALFFAWVLSFPLHGPVLFAAAAERYLHPEQLGLFFTFSHAGTLFLFGTMLKDENKWRQLMISSVILTLLLNILLIPVKSQIWFGIITILLGFSSSLFVIGWSVPFSRMIASSRLVFTALMMIWANIFYIVFSFLSRFLPANFLLCLVCLPLACAIIPAKACLESTDGKKIPPGERKTPYRILLLLSALIFCLYINGGIMYNTIIPSFIKLDLLNHDLVFLPYVGGLLFMWFIGRLIRKQATTVFPLYLAAGIMGLGFITMAFLQTSFLPYFAGGILILFSIGILDVFLWTILGQTGEKYANPYKVFGWGLSINVFALFCGDLLVQKWLAQTPLEHLVTPLLASGLIFFAILLTPLFTLQVERDLQNKLRAHARDMSSLNIGRLQSFPEMSALKTLTPREREIAMLILNGDSNKEIAKKLYISENTVKAHQKNINKKMGITSKHDLLALAVKALS